MTILSAKAYAKALFNSTNDIADLLKYQQALLTIKYAFNNNNFFQLVTNKVLQRSNILSILQDLLTPVFINYKLKNFCNLLVDNDLIADIANIVEEFDRLLADKNNQILVIMEYATTPSSQLIKVHEQFLQNKFNKNIKSDVQLNPDLIAGVKFTIGDLIIDASLKSRCRQLSASLMLLK